jgi:hypothetical protein
MLRLGILISCNVSTLKIPSDLRLRNLTDPPATPLKQCHLSSQVANLPSQATLGLPSHLGQARKQVWYAGLTWVWHNMHKTQIEDLQFIHVCETLFEAPAETTHYWFTSSKEFCTHHVLDAGAKAYISFYIYIYIHIIYIYTYAILLIYNLFINILYHIVSMYIYIYTFF